MAEFLDWPPIKLGDLGREPGIKARALHPSQLSSFPMSIWKEIGTLIATVTTDAFSAVVDSVKTVFAGDAETRRQVSFSIAIIALSAKMAKADGIVTPDEVEAFQEIFDVPPDEMTNVARLFNMAKQDVAGFQSYAKQVARLFPNDQAVLRDVMDGLFHIAKADSVLHENEYLFLEEVAVLLGFDERGFAGLKARHVNAGDADPYVVLDADPEWSFAQLKAQYRKRVRENHPDQMIARGVPKEFVRIATDRLAAINGAWEIIETLHQNKIETMVR